MTSWYFWNMFISVVEIYTLCFVCSTTSFSILQKPLGLLSLLDEESTFPNGTDLTFANKLKQHLKSNRCFRGEREKAFSVSHYAGEVMVCHYGTLSCAHLSAFSGISTGQILVIAVSELFTVFFNLLSCFFVEMINVVNFCGANHWTC